MFKNLINSIIAAFTALVIAALLVPGFSVSGDLKSGVKTLLLAGLVLGLINFFIKPLVNVVTWPLKVLTFGLFSLAVNIAIIWLISWLFNPQIIINGLAGLFLTSLIVWLLNMAAAKKD